MQILLVQHLYFWIHGLVWTDIRNTLCAEKAEKFVETLGWNKIYCWLCKCAADCANVLPYLLYHQFLNNQIVLFMLEIGVILAHVPRFFLCAALFILSWIIKECFLCLKLFRVFFFVNPGGFLIRVQSHELASNVHKPQNLYWYIFCISTEPQQRRGPGWVPVPHNEGIYVVNELNIATTVDFSVFTFFPVILYLCVWLIFPSLLQWIESNTFLTKLVFFVFVLIMYHGDTWCWFLASQVDLKMHWEC